MELISNSKKKADELVYYFSHYRFHIGNVDSRIMALRVANEMLNNEAIKDDSEDINDETKKCFWREVKRVIKEDLAPQIKLKEDFDRNQGTEPNYTC
jgi:hypothetical protein